MNKHLLHFVVLLLIPCLLADPVTASAFHPSPTRPSPFGLKIPARWGAVTEAYQPRQRDGETGRNVVSPSRPLTSSPRQALISPSPRPPVSQSPLVVLIQDLHGNIGVQRNIAEVIKYLNKQYGLRTVFTEGAKGPFNVSLLRNLPNAWVKKEAIKQFINEGILAGDEVAAIESQIPLHLWGVDDRELYLKNLQAFYRASLKSPVPHPKHPAWKPYYEVAKERDVPLTLNALVHLELLAHTSAPPSIVGLVAGGYHTEGITRILKTNHLSYVVVTPVVKSLGRDNKYVQQLRGLAQTAQMNTMPLPRALSDGLLALYQHFMDTYIRRKLVIVASSNRWWSKIETLISGFLSGFRNRTFKWKKKTITGTVTSLTFSPWQRDTGLGVSLPASEPKKVKVSFTIPWPTFPQRDLNTLQMDEINSDSQLSSAPKPLLFLVEDTPKEQKQYREELEQRGYEVQVFPNGEEVLDHLQQLRDSHGRLPDLILIDRNLGRGKMRGQNVAVVIREKDFAMPLLLWTKDDDDYYGQRTELPDGSSIVMKSKWRRGEVYEEIDKRLSKGNLSVPTTESTSAGEQNKRAEIESEIDDLLARAFRTETMRPEAESANYRFSTLSERSDRQEEKIVFRISRLDGAELRPIEINVISQWAILLYLHSLELHCEIVQISPHHMGVEFSLTRKPMDFLDFLYQIFEKEIEKRSPANKEIRAAPEKEEVVSESEKNVFRVRDSIWDAENAPLRDIFEQLATGQADLCRQIANILDEIRSGVFKIIPIDAHFLYSNEIYDLRVIIPAELVGVVSVRLERKDKKALNERELNAMASSPLEFALRDERNRIEYLHDRFSNIPIKHFDDKGNPLSGSYEPLPPHTTEVHFFLKSRHPIHLHILGFPTEPIPAVPGTEITPQPSSTPAAAPESVLNVPAFVARIDAMNDPVLSQWKQAWDHQLAESRPFWQTIPEFRLPYNSNAPHVAYDPYKIPVRRADPYLRFSLQELPESDALAVTWEEATQGADHSSLDRERTSNLLAADPNDEDFLILNNRWPKMPYDSQLVSRVRQPQRLTRSAIHAQIRWARREFVSEFHRPRRFVDDLHIHLYPSEFVPVTNAAPTFHPADSYSRVELGTMDYPVPHIGLVSEDPDALAEAVFLLSEQLERSGQWFNQHLLRIPGTNRLLAYFVFWNEKARGFNFNTSGFLKIGDEAISDQSAIARLTDAWISPGHIAEIQSSFWRTWKNTSPAALRKRKDKGVVGPGVVLVVLAFFAAGWVGALFIPHDSAILAGWARALGIPVAVIVAGFFVGRGADLKGWRRLGAAA